MTDKPRGRSIGQKRRHAVKVLKIRRRFLRELVAKRRLNQQPADREADEASVHDFVLRELAEHWPDVDPETDE